jgi:hypothetical protein
MEIKTNHHKYEAKVYPYDMTPRQKKQVESAYGGLIELVDAEFVFYRDQPYFMGDCMRLEQGNPFGAFWHGYFDDTFFSTIVVHYNDEDATYIFGLAFS